MSSFEFLARVFIDTDEDLVTEVNTWVHKLYPSLSSGWQIFDDAVKEALWFKTVADYLEEFKLDSKSGSFEILFKGTYRSFTTFNGEETEYDYEIDIDPDFQIQKCEEIADNGELPNAD